MTVHERVVLGQGSPEVASSQSQTDPVLSAREQKTLGVASTLTPSLYEPVSIHRPPPALLAEQGNLQFHVERLLKRRLNKGQYRYLVKWGGYLESENSWKSKKPLRQDCPYDVEFFSVALRISLYLNALLNNIGGEGRFAHQNRGTRDCLRSRKSDGLTTSWFCVSITIL